MNILYVCSDSGIPVLGRKGASVHVRSLVAAFTRQGHSVVVATPRLTGSPWEDAAPIDGAVMHVPPAEGIGAAVEGVRAFNATVGASNNLPGELRRILYNQQLETHLLRRFAQAPPDFIYERAALCGTAGLAAARALNVPLVVELNAPLALEQATYRTSSLPAIAAAAERHTLLGADAVVTVSSALREYVIGLGAAPGRVTVIPNGIDPELFAPRPRAADVRDRWRLGDGPVLGFVGGLRPWHGVRALPGLLARVAQRHPAARLVIAGDGPLRGELTAAFAEAGLDDRVIFTGAVPHDQVPDLVRQFDVAVAPYDPAGHLFYFSPLKLFEYMGCGVPVVAAALGQIQDVVRDRETGVLYQPGDADGLAGACEWLLEDPARRERVGRAAAGQVHARYTWSANAHRVVDLVRAAPLRLEACA